MVFDLTGWLERWWAGVPGTAWSDFASLSGLGLTTLAIAWAWWHTRCKVLWCVRPGRHAVSGTTWKVCPNHHTVAHHRQLAEHHRSRHPERLGHGDSVHPEPASSAKG